LRKSALLTFVYFFSNEHFQPLQNVIDTETDKKVEIDKVAQAFKSVLYENISKKFNSLWDDCDLGGSLSLLMYSKEQSTGTDKKWRPTNESARDQVVPHFVRVLQKKKALYDRIVQTQIDELSVSLLLPQLLKPLIPFCF